MSDEHNQDLAAMAALDLLEGEELAQWKRAVAADPSLAALESKLRESAAALAHLAPQVEPPADLKERLMSQIAKKEAGPAPVIPFKLYFAWAAAACFAVVAAWTGRMLLQERSENAQLRQEQMAADISIKSLKNDLEAGRIIDKQTVADLQNELAKKDALLASADDEIKQAGDMARFRLGALTSLNPSNPKAVGVAVWDPLKQKGVLEIANLPAAGPDKDYQLWVIDPQYKVPVNAGVFRINSDTGEAKVSFKADKPISSADKFAVSVEQRGGVPQAKGPLVLFTQ